jgi:hypothetical protein
MRLQPLNYGRRHIGRSTQSGGAELLRTAWLPTCEVVQHRHSTESAIAESRWVRVRPVSSSATSARNPVVRLRAPGRLWHAGKVLLEHGWTGIGADRMIANAGLAPRGRVLGLPAVA